MCNGLMEAGGICRAVYDPDPDKVAAFVRTYPGVKVANSLDEILNDRDIHMVASAAVPDSRCALGLRVMDAGKDYFTDKAPMTTLDHVAAVKAAVQRTGRKYMAYYSERIHVKSAVFAGQLVRDGAIGRVVQVVCLAPHRLGASGRPAWFFDRMRSGGILCDIGSHQIEQFLYFTGNDHARVVSSMTANYTQPNHPDFDDFGCATLVGDNGASQYFRVDWLTPDGLGAWGDGRLFLLGTKGYIEVRKYIDIARSPEGDQLYLADMQGERHIPVPETVGFPFFGELILDCLNRTENAMTQEHTLMAAQLCIEAQNRAVRIYGEERPLK